MVALVAGAWSTAKAGYADDENEDAYAVSNPGANEPLRVAVADGATGATFSGAWAKLLADDYAAGHLLPETLAARLALLTGVWQNTVFAKPLPWHAEAKIARDGSAAALLGVTVLPGGAYHALAVGDCNLFHLRPASDAGFAVACSFPQTQSGYFSGSPVLVGTQAETHAALAPHIKTGAGTLYPGDVPYAMSDALAAWFLREIESRQAPWRWLAALGTPRADAALRQMVRDLRDAKRLKDDDVVVARIEARDSCPPHTGDGRHSNRCDKSGGRGFAGVPPGGVC